MPKQGARDDIRMVLVDDHDLFRRGLKELLEAQGVDVVGEASSGEAGVKLAEALAPDVVAMDLSMPGMSGVEATKQLSVKAPRTRVLVLTVSGEDADVVDALMAGACGYLLKGASVEAIIDGIRAAAAGESSISPSVAATLLESIREQQPPPRTDDSALDKLSERELEILRLLATGLRNEQIAEQLVISPKTVKNHIANILMKLQVENRIQAAVYAVKQGLA